MQIQGHCACVRLCACVCACVWCVHYRYCLCMSLSGVTFEYVSAKGTILKFYYFFKLATLKAIVFFSDYKINIGAGERPQQLRTLAALPADRIQLSHPYAGSVTCDSSPKASNTLFWPLWSPGMHTVDIHTCRQIHIKITKKIFKNKTNP